MDQVVGLTRIRTFPDLRQSGDFEMKQSEIDEIALELETKPTVVPERRINPTARRA